MTDCRSCDQGWHNKSYWVYLLFHIVGFHCFFSWSFKICILYFLSLPDCYFLMIYKKCPLPAKMASTILFQLFELQLCISLLYAASFTWKASLWRDFWRNYVHGLLALQMMEPPHSCVNTSTLRWPSLTASFTVRTYSPSFSPQHFLLFILTLFHIKYWS